MQIYFFSYSLMEFDTFVRHKLPVIGIIGNDACWTQIAREQVPLFKTAVACDLDVIHIFMDYLLLYLKIVF